MKKKSATGVFFQPERTQLHPSAVSDSKLSWQEQKEQQARERKRKNDLKKTEEEISRLEERTAKLIKR